MDQMREYCWSKEADFHNIKCMLCDFNFFFGPKGVIEFFCLSFFYDMKVRHQIY